MKQCEIRARGDCKMVIGDFGRVCATRIHHHDGEAFGIAFFALEQPLKQHRMAFGGVRADQEGHRTVIEILVATGWAV